MKPSIDSQLTRTPFPGTYLDMCAVLGRNSSSAGADLHLGRLSSTIERLELTSPQNGRTSFAYDGAGREVRKALANGVLATHIYDAAGQTAGMVTGQSGGMLIRRLTYTYDGAGRRSMQRSARRLKFLSKHFL